MLILQLLFSIISAPLCSLAYSLVQAPLLSNVTKDEPKIRPLVLWHGLGDSYNSPGMIRFADLIKEIHPGIFIHSVYIDPELDKDRQAAFFGNVNEQLELVSNQLADIEELSEGFDAIGFSQGGQFWRAYVERYNNPPVHNLLTFGSQHMGISDIPLCRPLDLVCQAARRAARAGVYTEWAQKNLVQAQYFRDPDQLPAYYATNKFLTSINNEIPETANASYTNQFLSLNKLILVLFSQDKTVVPKESSWFGSYAPPEEEGERLSDPNVKTEAKTIVPMRLQPVYLSDTFGLKTLDKRGDVLLETCEGEHMHLSDECWQPLVRRFVGGKLS